MRRVARPAIFAVFLGSLSLLPGPRVPPAGAQEGLAPNVLIIVTDDQRLGTLGVMPETRRWFGEGGREFTNAFVSIPLCCPSRASILSGRYAHNHGVHQNSEAGNLNQDATIQRYLHDAGYFTALTGKFLNSWPVDADPPHFDRWAMLKNGYFKRRFNVDGQLQQVKGYSTDFIGGWAANFVEWAEGEDERPWFLYVAPFAPHGPFTPAPRHEDDHVPGWVQSPAVEEEDVADKPPFVQSFKSSIDRLEVVRADQLRTLMAVDEMVERIVDALAEHEEQGRTIAFFLSDNGFFWFEHGLRDKRLPYTDAVKVPFFVRWSGQVEPGTRDAGLVSIVDIVPTILEAAGVTAPPGTVLDGRSLLGADSRERAFMEYYVGPGKHIPGWASIRTDRYQYIEYYAEDGTLLFREYYNLERDPWQLENLLAEGVEGGPTPEEIAALKEQLSDDRTCAGTAEPSPSEPNQPPPCP
jgi:arylsulfatase A-like enzyme